ncbi:MAG TPA: SDR family oxidoreductase [Nitrososphaeraceae archaeon]
MRNENKSNILVTGATGTVGSEVVKQLASLGQSVKAAVHTQSKADKIKHNKKIDIVSIDYNKPETVADALRGVDKVFLVTLPSPDMANVSSNLVKEAEKNEINYIIKLSVLGAGAEPETILGRVHRQEEKIIEESGIPYTFLRSGAFMQNFVNFFGQTIKQQNAFYLPAGEGKVSFVDIRDIASAAADLLVKNHAQYKNKGYGITGQEALSYSQAADILSEQLGRTISYVDIPEETARKGMKGAGMTDWLIDGLLELYAIIRAGHAAQTTTAIEEITGRKPILFSQFAKDYAEALV